MAGASDFRIIFIKSLAILKNQVHVNDERFQIQVLVVAELFSDGGEVHGLLDDLPVAWDSFVVDRCEEGPSVLMGLQLGQQHSAHRQTVRVAAVFVRFGFFGTGDGAVMSGLGARRAVVSFPLLELLGTFLWHAVAAGSLLFDELS